MKIYVGLLLFFLSSMFNPAAGAAQPMPNDLYVGYTVDPGYNRIDVYDGIAGIYKMPFAFTASPSPVGGVALGPDGNLYVGFSQGEVQVYDQNGFLVNVFFANGPVSGMDFGMDGLLYVAYADFPIVEIFDGPSGSFIGPSNLVLFRPAGGLAIDSSGNFYVGYDTFPYSVEVFEQSGFMRYPQIFDVGSPISGLTVNSWGELLVGISDSPNVKKYAPGSDFLLETFPAMVAPAGGLACFNDSDWDGLSDISEATVHGTDPHNLDTDFDSKTDGDEVNLFGTDPLDPNS